MIGIDTNVLVRYLSQDDEAQAEESSRIIDGFTAEAPGFVSQVALVETVWVLTRAYKMQRTAIADIVEALLRSRDIVVEHTDVAYLALATYKLTKADFSDAVIAHVGRLAGCTKTLTFDSSAATDAGMIHLRV